MFPVRPHLLSLAPVLALLWLMGCSGEEEVIAPPLLVCGDPGTICTVMGTGQSAYLGEGQPPGEVALYWPIDMTFDNEGRFLVLDYNNQRVRRVDHDGLVRTIMGTGIEASVEDGSPALETSLHHAFSLCYDAAGNLYLAGNHVPQLFKLTTGDKSYVIAGLDLPGYSGDGGPALEAELDSPCGLAVHSSGYPIYFADTFNHAVRRIDSDQTVTTIAGRGISGYSGDNGPAVDALLSSPYRVRLDESTGDLYVTDTENSVIRKIDAGGTITTIAGTGEAGYGGDGGLATEAVLSTPLDARLGPDGAVYIADSRNNRVRRVDPSGIITTIVGTGVEGADGDGGPATEAQLNHPSAVLFGPDGNLWVADAFNSKIRRVVLPSP
jgi:hypothetical protein